MATDGELGLMLNRLVEAIKNSPPPPCDGCRLYQRCKHESLACRAFKLYLNKSLDDTPYPYAISIPRKKIYNKIFVSCDKCKHLCAECK